jgi:hypothetical protein
MLKELRKTRKMIALVLVLALLVPMGGNISFANEEPRVRVTYVPNMLWGGFGQYVEYELDGVNYRTDEASSAINRKAWSLMSQEDKRKTYDRLYTTSARKAAFGDDGWQDIVSWIRETNEWFIANRVWKDRIAKRDFPDIHAVYNDQQSLSTLFSDYDEMKNYIIPSIVSQNNMARERFTKNLVELEQYYSVGKEYYNKVKDMRGKSIGMVASFTMMQVTQMLSDLLFLPSVSNLASIPRSGMIADLIGVMQQSLGLEGGDLLEKANRVLEGGESAHLTVEEQVRFYGALIQSYATLAERYYKQVEEKIKDLRNDYREIKEHAASLEYTAQEDARKKEEEKNSYKKALDEVIVIPPDKEPEEEIIVTLAFKWKTEAELKTYLFNDNLNEWLNNFGDIELAYENAAEMVFQEIIEQKKNFDNETKGKLNLITPSLVEAYNNIINNVSKLEIEVAAVEKAYDDQLPEDEYDFYRIEVGGQFFYGDKRFSPDLENFANQDAPYDFYYGDLRAHIQGYKSKAENLLDTLKEIKDGYGAFYDNIKQDVEGLVYYLDLLKALEKNYSDIYENPVWQLTNATGSDNSPGYSKIQYIDPKDKEEYKVNNFQEFLKTNDILQEIYNVEVEDLSINRPTHAYTKAYEVYEELLVKESILLDSYNDTFINEDLYKNGRKSYYDEMDNRLEAYLTAQDKMEGAFGKIRTIVDDYEGLWEGTYFTGGYDHYKYQPYLYNTLLPSMSAFDIAGLRSYIRDGGNTAIILNKLKTIERKVGEYEVQVADLIGKINSSKLEMELIIDDSLGAYGTSKGENLEDFYSLRDKYDLFNKWNNLTMSSDNSLNYFNICDLPKITEILSGETDVDLFLKDSIKKIRGYRDSKEVDIYSTSNRLYDIYRYATGIKDLYRGTNSAYEKYGLTTEDYRTEILKLYANPGDGDDILNSINDLMSEHEGLNYTYPPSPYEGIDVDDPVGEPEVKATMPGMVNIKANIYHPLAVNASSINYSLYIYDNGWTEVDSISKSDDLGLYIDPENDMLTIPFMDLEDGREYRLDWEITHSPNGSALYEKGNHYFTYNSPKGVFTSVELNKDTYDSVDITIINNSDSDLENRKMSVDGYDYEGEFVETQVESLNLPIGEKTTITVYFDEPVYEVELSIEGVENQDPQEFIDWPIEETVDKYKVWRIKFNYPVDESTVIKRNIYIKNGNGEIQDITPYLDELDEKSEIIIIYPPKEGYVEGYEYTLYITTDIKSKDGRELINGIKIKFYIE